MRNGTIKEHSIVPGKFSEVKLTHEPIEHGVLLTSVKDVLPTPRRKQQFLARCAHPEQPK
jgi:hypothetical protein